jgi:hypothetical protein
VTERCLRARAYSRLRGKGFVWDADESNLGDLEVGELESVLQPRMLNLVRLFGIADRVMDPTRALIQLQWNRRLNKR